MWEEEVVGGGGDAKDRQKMKYRRSVEVITPPTASPKSSVKIIIKLKSKITVKDHLLLSRPLKSDGFVLNCLL